jgi:hypothetical protein
MSQPLELVELGQGFFKQFLSRAAACAFSLRAGHGRQPPPRLEKK